MILVLMYLHAALCVWLLREWVGVIPVRFRLMFLFVGPSHHIHLATWQNAKDMIEAGHFSDAHLERDKARLCSVLLALVHHPLYDKISPYNYRMPVLMGALRTASTAGELGQVRSMIVSSFSGAGWWPGGRKACIIQELLPLSVGTFYFWAATCVLVNV